METKKLLERLVSDPEEIKELFGPEPQLKKHIHFGLQINIDDQNGKNQDVLYNELLLFLTKLPYNYIGLNQSRKEFKNKVGFLLPKKAFKQYVNESLKTYSYKKIEEKLSLLGKNKVVTQRNVIVDLFTVFQIKGLDDFWGILIDISTTPYICTPEITLMLALIKAIPYIPTPQNLELSDMIEEREKAGLYIPVMMNVINSAEFVTHNNGDISDSIPDEVLQEADMHDEEEKEYYEALNNSLYEKGSKEDKK